jgi:hypothetical protein
VAITAPPAARTVTLSIDGQELTVAAGATIYDAAKGAGIEIPHGRPPPPTAATGAGPGCRFGRRLLLT